jgi:hypothetical protein
MLIHLPVSINQISETTILNLKKFLFISGIIYLLWAILGVAIALTVTSDATINYGLWAGCLLLTRGIIMHIVISWTCDAILHLIRMFALDLFFSLTGFILLAFNYTTSSCLYYVDYSCDSDLTSNLKLVFVYVFIVAILQSVINLTVTCNARKKILSTLLVPAFQDQQYFI